MHGEPGQLLTTEILNWPLSVVRSTHREGNFPRSLDQVHVSMEAIATSKFTGLKIKVRAEIPGTRVSTVFWVVAM